VLCVAAAGQQALAARQQAEQHDAGAPGVDGGALLQRRQQHLGRAEAGRARARGGLRVQHLLLRRQVLQLRLLRRRERGRHRGRQWRRREWRGQRGGGRRGGAGAAAAAAGRRHRRGRRRRRCGCRCRRLPVRRRVRGCALQLEQLARGALGARGERDEAALRDALQLRGQPVGRAALPLGKQRLLRLRLLKRLGARRRKIKCDRAGAAVAVAVAIAGADADVKPCGTSSAPDCADAAPHVPRDRCSLGQLSTLRGARDSGGDLAGAAQLVGQAGARRGRRGRGLRRAGAGRTSRASARAQHRRHR